MNQNLCQILAVAAPLFFAAVSVLSACTPDHNGIGSKIKAGEALVSSGRFTEAEKHFRELVKDRAATAQGTQKVDCLNLLGVSLQGQGRYLEAIEVYRTALAQIRSENGNGNGNIHYRRAKILSNLASSLNSVNKSKEAVALCEESLATFKNEKSAETERSVVLNTYGEALAQEARLSAAETAFSDAIKIREQLGTEFSADLIGPLLNLSTCQLAGGEVELAKKSCKRALEISKRSGAQPDEQLAILSNLINIDIEQSDFASAKVNIQQAIAIRETLFGKTEAGVIELLQNLALMQKYTGEEDVAKSTMGTIADRTRFSPDLQPNE